jgi:hypothetical protein
VAREQIASIANAVADVAFVGRMPPLEVRTMFAILAPGELFSRQRLEAAGDRW